MLWYWLLLMRHVPCDAACQVRFAEPAPIWPWIVGMAIACLLGNGQYLFVLWLSLRNWWRGRP